MRIVSKFSDFYDGVGVNDTSDKPVYVRHTSVHRSNEPKNGFSFAPSAQIVEYLNKTPRLDLHRGSKISFRKYGVGFCGKFYPIWVIEGKPFVDASSYFKAVSDGSIGENWSNVMSFQAKRDLYEEHQELVEKLRARNDTFESWNRSWLNFNESGCEAFRDFLKHYPLGDEAFRSYNVPVIVVRDTRECRTVTLNPNLGLLGFQKHVDPYTAYQEIDMFLGNNLAKQEVRGTVGGDLIARDMHGFDEWTFKNIAPGEKKLRRKQNKRKKRRANDLS